MKLHLVRMAKAQGQARFPGVEGFEARVLRAPEAVDEARMYLVLEGELIIDLPDRSYLHLRRNEAAHLQHPHNLVPVESAVVVVWKP
ncbi:MAG: hypothetical protein C4333_09110 [Meiothermus sp.]